MTMTYTEFLKRRYRWSHVVQVLDLNPDARATLRGQGDYLFRYPGVGQVMHLAFWMSMPVAGWSIATGRWWVVPAGIGVYTVDRVRRTRHEGRPTPVRAARAPLELVALAVESVGFAVQSVRYRALLL